MIEMIENRVLALQKEEEMSLGNQTRKNIKVIGKKVNISPGIIVGCLELNRLILI